VTDLSQFDATKVLYLTTMGRISGLRRTIEIWFVVHHGDIYVLAEHGHQANWVKNINANPHVHIRIADQELDARGRILDPVLDQDLWRTIQDLARQKFDWGEGLPVQLTPYQPS
jgi:deazaflavin-dependent oxidoreductase (nitroreductase family)